MLRTVLIATALLTASLPAFADTEREREAEQKAEAQQDQTEDQNAKDQAAKAPPPAIPGAANGGPIVKSDRAASDLSPNDSLFDAITRGDLNAARDAMNRGAQLEARNVLGQTPLESSIDLNRNAITFMLLSLRGSDTGKAPVTPTQVAAATPKASSHHHGNSAIVQTATAPRVIDPGTPNPSAGFLGF